MVDSPPQPCQQQQKSHHDVESNYRDNYATIFAGSYAKDLDTLRKQVWRNDDNVKLLGQ